MADKFTDYAVNSTRWLSIEDFDGEIWKDIPDFKGFYLVSNYGRVKTVSRKRMVTALNVSEKIKKHLDNGHGYLSVHLYKNNKLYIRYVHRLVASAFIPNPLNFPCVNHRDENKTNNSIINLEWCSYDYNNKYGTARFRLEKARRNNGNIRSVDMYDLKGNFLKHYECAFDVEKDGLSRRGVYGVCYGRSRSYKGCVFRFSGEPFSYRETDKHKKGEKKEVIKTNRDGIVVCIYPSIKKAEKENGLPRNYLYFATYASTRRALINDFFFEIRKY